MHRSVYMLAAVALTLNVACSVRSVEATNPTVRTVTVAQSGSADVVGSDSAALQKAADMLRPGDTLAIGPGTYQMDASLLIPSGVTVRGTAGKTILMKSRGVESPLAEDGDYGESYLNVAQPEKFRPGMGVELLDDSLNSGWDVSISKVVAVNGHMVQISPMTVRDYDLEHKHARMR